MTESQAAATRFCARVIGPLMLIIGAIVVIRFHDIAMMMPAILQDAPLAFITGIFTLIVGLILFVAHHHWTSPTAILISLLGVLTVVRGVLLMMMPDAIAAFATQALQAGPAPLIAGGVAILIGLWLSYAGWFAKTAA